MIEHFFQCPYYWASISMLLDLSVTEDQYIEDCEVCCNPIQIDYREEDGGLAYFEAHPIGQ